MSNLSRSLGVSFVLAFGLSLFVQFGCGQIRQYLPIIVDLKVEKQVLKPGEKTDIRAKIAAEDRKKLTSNWTTPNGFQIKNWSAADEVGTVVAPSNPGVEAELTLKISNNRGNSDERSITVRTAENHAPNIVDVSATPRTVEPGGTVDLAATATDANHETLNYTWSAPANWSISDSAKAETTLTAPNTFGASASVEVKVTDGKGASATRTVHLSTTTNDPPTVASVQAQPSTVGPAQSTTLNVRAEDPEGSSLSYTWSGPSNWSIASPNSKQPQVTAPSTFGSTATFTIQVTDADGASTTGEILVSVRAQGGPEIIQVSASPQQAPRGGQIIANVSTEGGSNLSYSWSASNNWSVSATSSDPSEATVTAPNTPSSLGTVQVTVTDGSGLSTTASKSVSTVQNKPPVITQPTQDLALSDAANPSPLYPGRPVTYNALQAEDPDGDTLTYSLQSNSGAAIDSSTGVISWTPTFSDSGFYTWTVKVSDGYDTVQREIEIGVAPQFGLSVASSSSVNSNGTTFADINGDGYEDLIGVTSRCGLKIAEGGARGFSSYPRSTSGRSGCNDLTAPAVPAVADFDSDGDLDVVIVTDDNAGGSGGFAYWYLWKNDGNGNFSPGASGSWAINTGFFAVGDVEAGDVDGDGAPDLVTIFDGEWLVAFNDGSASFGSYAEKSGGYEQTNNVAIADFVSGGKNEIAVTNEVDFGDPGTVEFWRVSGGTSLTKLTQVQIGKASGNSEPRNIGVADFDGDSDLDVAAYNESPLQIVYVDNQGSGTFAQSGIVDLNDELLTRPGVMHLATGDLDGDGNVDIVSGFDFGNDGFSIIRGNGSFGAKSVTDVRPSGQSLGDVDARKITDWDGDGTPDLLWADPTDVGIAK